MYFTFHLWCWCAKEKCTQEKLYSMLFHIRRCFLFFCIKYSHWECENKFSSVILLIDHSTSFFPFHCVSLSISVHTCIYVDGTFVRRHTPKQKSPCNKEHLGDQGDGRTDAPDRQVYRKRHTHRGMTDKGRREEGSFGERPKGIGEKGREQGRKRERERKREPGDCWACCLPVNFYHARTHVARQYTRESANVASVFVVARSSIRT